MPKALSSFATSSPGEPRLTSQKKLAWVLGSISEWAIVATAALVPLVYCTTTSQALDFPKQATLMLGVSVAALAWMGSILVERGVVLRRSVANAVALLFLTSVAVSALLSKSKYVSVVGDYGQEYQSLVTTLLLVLLFFIIVHAVDRKGFIERLLVALLAGGGLAALVGVLQFNGIRVIPFVSATGFNTVGSTVALGMFASVIVALASAYLLTERSGALPKVKRIVAGVAGIAGLLAAIAIDFWPVWVTLVIGLLVVLVYSIIRPESIRRLTWLAVPMGALVIAILFLFVDAPVAFRAPTEVFPSVRQTFTIARDTLARSPVFGSGPGTFAQDFALFRDRELNASPLWYIRFDRGGSHLGTLAATLGIAGLVTWLAVIVTGFMKSAAYLVRKRKDDGRWVLTLAITVAWFASATSMVVYGSSLALQFLFWLSFALLVRLTATDPVVVKFESSPRAALGTTFVFVMLVVFSIAGWFIMGTRLASDVTFVRATTRDLGRELDTAIGELESAARLNQRSDLIARNLAQAYLAKIQNVIADESLSTEARREQVQTLTAAAVGAGRTATELSSVEAANWSLLGAVYATISPYVTGASDEAVKAIQRAAELEPSSPAHPTDLARHYLGLADLAAAEVEAAKDEGAKSGAQERMNENLSLAERELNAALALKSDFAAASFQLALVLDRRGKLQEATEKLEEVRRLSPNDVGVAFQLGLLYYRSNDKSKAAVELERAVSLTPSYANARWFLSLIYEEGNRLDDALAQVRAILETNPDNQTVQERVKILEDKKAGILPEAGTTPGPLPEGQGPSRGQ